MKTIIFYSGQDTKANPETVLQEEANVMLTYQDVHANKGKLPVRYKRMFKARRKREKLR